MILSECRGAVGDRLIEIIGTDLARDQVQRARDGVYTQFEVQRGLPVQLLMRHFRKEENGWRISEAIRGMVQYREWNLLGDLRPLGQFDVVFCRNVLTISISRPRRRCWMLLRSRCRRMGCCISVERKLYWGSPAGSRLCRPSVGSMGW